MTGMDKAVFLRRFEVKFSKIWLSVKDLQTKCYKFRGAMGKWSGLRCPVFADKMGLKP
jgi:hypothetical protein